MVFINGLIFVLTHFLALQNNTVDTQSSLFISLFWHGHNYLFCSCILHICICFCFKNYVQSRITIFCWTLLTVSDNCDCYYCLFHLLLLIITCRDCYRVYSFRHELTMLNPSVENKLKMWHIIGSSFPVFIAKIDMVMSNQSSWPLEKFEYHIAQVYLLVVWFLEQYFMPLL